VIKKVRPMTAGMLEEELYDRLQELHLSHLAEHNCPDPEHCETRRLIAEAINITAQLIREKK
jgi:hypothetical protein